jgi:hypothetical protein
MKLINICLVSIVFVVSNNGCTLSNSSLRTGLNKHLEKGLDEAIEKSIEEAKRKRPLEWDLLKNRNIEKEMHSYIRDNVCVSDDCALDDILATFIFKYPPEEAPCECANGIGDVRHTHTDPSIIYMCFENESFDRPQAEVIMVFELSVPTERVTSKTKKVISILQSYEYEKKTWRLTQSSHFPQ